MACIENRTFVPKYVIADNSIVVHDYTMLEKITHLIDADGFTLRGDFWVREMTILRLSDNQATRYEFRLPFYYDELTDEEKSAVIFLCKRIHGMRFSSRVPVNIGPRVRALRKADKDEALKCLQEYITAEEKTCPHPLFAYKGGYIEMNWLTKLGIPSVNLEIFGCPKFDVLVRDPYYLMIANDTNAVHRLEDGQAVGLPRMCDLHKHASSRQLPAHCPVGECRVFAVWIFHQIMTFT